MDETKICKKCGRELPIEKYAIHTITGYISKTCKDFYGNLIRECFNEKFLMVWKFSKGE